MGGMRHGMGEGIEGESSDEEADAGAYSGVYAQPGWLVQEVTVGRLGNMRTITREVYAPADCEILETNPRLRMERGMVNEAAESDGWLVKVRFSGEVPDLVDAPTYVEQVAADAVE